LNNIVEEKQDRLRGRRFKTIWGSKPNSIHSRLTKAASQIGEIAKFKSIESLTKSLKEKALDQYRELHVERETISSVGIVINNNRNPSLVSLIIYYFYINWNEF
jgi:hypothetical protein